MTGGKIFIVVGIIFIIIGLLWTFVGKLPGDMSFKKGNVSFHFPLMTSLIVSVIISFVLFIMNKFR